LAELAKLLTGHEIKVFQRRLDQLVAGGRFPLPVGGRNVPYPPI